MTKSSLRLKSRRLLRVDKISTRCKDLEKSKKSSDRFIDVPTIDMNYVFGK